MRVGASRQLFIAARVQSAGHLHVHLAHVRPRHRAVRIDQSRSQSVYRSAPPPKSGTVSGQVLLSYKLNWQSVMFIGYGDDRMLSTQDRFEKVDRQFFVKLSYALQR